MRYGILVSLVFALALFSCKNDDDGSGVEEVPPSLLSDVAPEDDAKIKEFLNTHFYNYEDFDPATQPADFDFKIRIDTIAGENADKDPMMKFAQSITINVSSSHVGLNAGEEDVPHKLYYIEVMEGGSEGRPTYADSTLIRYQGSLLDGTIFDENQEFAWADLSTYTRGYANGVAQLRTGTSDQVVDNEDGTYDIANSGKGILIVPSGLAYFNNSPSSLMPSYSILMFKVELGLYVEDTDSDNDGIPNTEEDLNGNGYLFDDNTDADSEGSSPIPNFRDVDDDGDGVSTRSEVTDDDGNIIFPYPDADGDGVPDYLDPDTK